MKSTARKFFAVLGVGVALVIASAVVGSPVLFMAGIFTAMGSLSVL